MTKKREAWPVLKAYDGSHLSKIAMPLGGIGTGTVSLTGRGGLKDWEVMNQPAKGFTPHSDYFVTYPMFCLYARPAGGEAVSRLLEGPVEPYEYESATGCIAPNHGYPRYRECTFSAAYPLAQVTFGGEDMPVDARLEAFNPLVPGDADASGVPVAVLRYVLTNRTNKTVEASVCGVLPNFVGWNGPDTACKANRNRFHKGRHVRGVFMDSKGVDPEAAQWGTLALTTTAPESAVTYRLSEPDPLKGNYVLDLWEDFCDDGALNVCKPAGRQGPLAALAAAVRIPAKGVRELTFLITWHFPNRYTWSPGKKDGDQCCASDRIGNYYTTRYRSAWDAAEKTAAALPELERETVKFVRAFCEADLPAVVKEAALFNVSTLRSQTCFRTPDGRLYGFEGCNNNTGCCHGSCTHVWNYEQAAAHLFGDLSLSMRDVEFAHATDASGLMSFRVNLPLARAQEIAFAAADGQMGCIMKMYRDWQLSGDDATLERLWPKVRKALEFCWLPGGWDADRDGVMEGSQHNTMDCEYYGPNPQMELWYLGALRAAEEMARYLKDTAFAESCRDLFERGSAWTDANLFNGEYYEHQIRPPRSADDVRPGTGTFPGVKKAEDLTRQLGKGCLVDQLVGQYMAHVCGLGYLVKPAHVRKTLKSIMKYNYRDNFHDHFNCMRGYVIGAEKALLMAAYPGERPAQPFPYFTEVMTGFEYVAAVGMLQEGQKRAGLECIKNIRDRYDGAKRSPFNEAECGHHYARAMASWAAVTTLSGFGYSAVTGELTFAAQPGKFFWSTGWAWGTVEITKSGSRLSAKLTVLHGALKIRRLVLSGAGLRERRLRTTILTGRSATFHVS